MKPQQNLHRFWKKKSFAKKTSSLLRYDIDFLQFISHVERCNLWFFVLRTWKEQYKRNMTWKELPKTICFDAHGYAQDNLHPGKLTAGTRNQRFGRWCSFSRWWFAGFGGCIFPPHHMHMFPQRLSFRCSATSYSSQRFEDSRPSACVVAKK